MKKFNILVVNFDNQNIEKLVKSVPGTREEVTEELIRLQRNEPTAAPCDDVHEMFLTDRGVRIKCLVAPMGNGLAYVCPLNVEHENN